MDLGQLNKKMMTAVGESPYQDRIVINGEGSGLSGIVLIGEAPGGEEEKQKRPFVGSAGKNLNEFLEILGLNRDEIYITNVVKIRPYKLSAKTGKAVNRTPDRNEIRFFTPFLWDEIKCIGPRYVLTLGNVPLRALMRADEPSMCDGKVSIGQVHGQLMQRQDFALFPLYHPASIIYRRELREVYLQDLLAFKAVMHGDGTVG